MKKMKKAYYLVPACAGVVLVLGLLYYFLLTGFSSRSETCYVYVDEDDTADSLYAKLDSIASHHGTSYAGQPQLYEEAAAYGPLCR